MLLPVKEAMLMHISKSFSDLSDYGPYRIFFHEPASVLILHVDFKDILVEKFEYETQFILNFENFLEFDDIRMIELSESFYLLELHALVPRRVLLFKLFDCNSFIRFKVNCLINRSVSSVTELF